MSKKVTQGKLATFLFLSNSELKLMVWVLKVPKDSTL